MMKHKLATSLGGVHEGLKSSLMNSITIPQISIPRRPTVREQHEYESASELLDHFVSLYRRWQKEIPADVEIHMIALMHGGVSVDVRTLHAAGHSGLLIKGIVDGKECLFFAHQASVQILCYFQTVEKGVKPIVIGFGADPAGKEA